MWRSDGDDPPERRGPRACDRRKSDYGGLALQRSDLPVPQVSSRLTRIDVDEAMCCFLPCRLRAFFMVRFRAYLYPWSLSRVQDLGLGRRLGRLTQQKGATVRSIAAVTAVPLAQLLFNREGDLDEAIGARSLLGRGS